MFDETTTEEVVEQESTGADQPFADLAPESSDETAEQPVQQPETDATEPPTTEEETTYTMPDEQAKVFPDEVLVEFAQNRYPELAKALADQSLPEPTRQQIKQIVHDKLNGDIYIEKLRQAEEQQDEAEEEEQEETAEPTQQANPEAWQKAVQSFVDNVTDEKAAQTFFDELNAAAALKDPKERAVKFTKTLSGAAVNLMRDAIPALLFGKDGQPGMIDQYIESRYEGLGESHTSALRSGDWESVKQSDPAYANLPAFGTPEFVAMAQKAAATVPGIENAVFTGPNGQALSPRQQFIEKSKLLAKLAAGTATQGTVEKATKAVETGRRLQKESQQRKSVANLGAGQTKGQIAPQVQSGLDAERKASIARLREDENPFAVLNSR